MGAGMAICCTGMQTVCMETQTVTPQQRQQWIARTVNTIAASHGLHQQRDIAQALGWTESKLSRKLHQDSRFSLERDQRSLRLHLPDPLGRGIRPGQPQGLDHGGVMTDPTQTLQRAATGWRTAQQQLNAARETLAREVRFAVNAGVSQSEVARIVGVDRLTVRKWMQA